MNLPVYSVFSLGGKPGDPIYKTPKQRFEREWRPSVRVDVVGTLLMGRKVRAKK
jgi:hypothetical protein